VAQVAEAYSRLWDALPVLRRSGLELSGESRVQVVEVHEQIMVMWVVEPAEILCCASGSLGEPCQPLEMFSVHKAPRARWATRSSVLG
jgi:hypothetical protein